jgi:predicted ATPase
VADTARSACADLTIVTARYEVVVLEGCDGTGKTTLAADLEERHGYVVLHSDRPPDDDMAARYRSILERPGKIALDRSFISELVYGPLRHGGSRLSAPDAADLAFRVADRGGVLVHLTGSPDKLAARLRARDGYAPPVARLREIIGAYRSIFSALADAAPVITADTTVATCG